MDAFRTELGAGSEEWKFIAAFVDKFTFLPTFLV
jgi:hypothetical protein